MNPEKERATQLSHLMRMAQIEGWKHYAWHRAQELAKTDLYAGIDKQLLESMKNGQRNENAGTDPVGLCD
jgi:hypothetical protein